ncbi:MAG: hypothetical protein NTU79_23415 [Planctomycetota bacterium]|nr:hypothetical protein [Planctomycetota bacterium]
MFRTTKTLVHAGRFWALPLALNLCSMVPCLAQNNADDDEPAGNSPSTSVFSKLFGSPSKKPSTSAPKPKTPATPTASKGTRNGFLVPLKSFSKVFRGNSETDFTEELEGTRVAPPSASRTPREPFRTLPRVQELRDRASNDIQVEKGALDFGSPQLLDTPTRAAPIVRSSQSLAPKADPQSNGLLLLSSPNTPMTTSTKREEPKISSSDLVLESNSTSRRTAMDNLETETPSRPVSPPPTSKPVSKTRANPEIAKANSNSNQLTAIALDTTRNLEATSKLELGASDSSDGPKISRTNTANRTAVATKSKEPDKHATPKPATTPNIPTASLQKEMALPGVRVSVNGPTSMLVNQDGSYELIVKNEGTEPLNGLAMRVAVPHHVTLGKTTVSGGTTQMDNDQDGNAVVWELDHVPAGGSKSIQLVMQTSKPEHFALGVEWTVLPQSTELQIQIQQPQLALALEGPSEVEFGKPQMYRIRVRNPGNSDAKAVLVSLSAEPYGNNQSDIGDVAAGSERIVEVELTFEKSGSLPIKATATSSPSQLKAESSIEVQVRQSELVATWFGPTEFYQGSVADFDLELTNTGSIPAVATICKVRLPSGTEVVSLPPGAVRSGEFVKWDIKKIGTHEKMTFPFRLSLTKIGDNPFAFTAECSSGGESKADFSTIVDSIADLHLSVVDPTAPAPVGQPVVYEIVITNRGKKAASDIEVIAQFSEGIEPLRLEGHTGRVVPGQAIFNSIPSIQPNEKLVLRIVAEASKPGVHRFRAEVKSLGSDTDLLEEESTRYLATGLKPDRR